MSPAADHEHYVIWKREWEERSFKNEAGRNFHLEKPQRGRKRKRSALVRAKERG